MGSWKMKEERLFKGKSENCDDDDETNVVKLDSKQQQVQKENCFTRKTTDHESHWGM